MLNVDDSVSLRRCGSSWNHYHDPSSTQPPHLQAFLRRPFFCGQNTRDPPSSHTSKCTDGVNVWRHHSGSLELHHPAWLGGFGWLAQFQILYLKTSVHSLSSRGLQGTGTPCWLQIALPSPITPVMWPLPSLSHPSRHTARSSATIILWSPSLLFSR